MYILQFQSPFSSFFFVKYYVFILKYTQYRQVTTGIYMPVVGWVLNRRVISLPFLRKGVLGMKICHVQKHDKEIII